MTEPGSGKEEESTPYHPWPESPGFRTAREERQKLAVQAGQKDRNSTSQNPIETTPQTLETPAKKFSLTEKLKKKAQP